MYDAWMPMYLCNYPSCAPAEGKLRLSSDTYMEYLRVLDAATATLEFVPMLSVIS